MPQVTFAVCVEAGGFEAMSVRLVQSLRRFGGRFADCPVIVVTPRFGPRFSRDTLAAYQKLGVDYTIVRPNEKYTWYPFLNKPVTMLAAEARAKTPLVCYVDSDMIFAGDPDLLDLDHQTDFAACASDKNFGVGDDPADENLPFWREFAQLNGLDFDALPTVRAHRENTDIRIYFNSGLFCYRVAAGVAKAYRQIVVNTLDAKLSSKTAKIYFHEQAAIGLVPIQLGLKWKNLPHTYNYAMGPKIMNLYEPDKVRDVKILHYHGMMWPENWSALLEKLKVDRPDLHDWLAPLGPLQASGSALQKGFAKLLGRYRTRQYDAHRTACRVV